MIELGTQVRDKLTGFEGVATARVEYVTGVIKYEVQPRVREDGKMPDVEWISSESLELVGK